MSRFEQHARGPAVRVAAGLLLLAAPLAGQATGVLTSGGAAGTLADWRPAALSPFARAKAEALLKDRLPCLGCHRLGKDGGRIGPSFDGLAARRDPAYVRAIIADPQAVAPGSLMPRMPMPAATVDLIAAYLSQRDRAAPAPAPSPARPPGDAAAPPLTPAGLYARHCAACHGERGRGDGWNAADLPVRPTSHASAELMAKRPDDTLFDGIHAGGLVLGKSARMPAFGHTLTPDLIRGLVRHIRALCQCEGPSWSRDGG